MMRDVRVRGQRVLSLSKLNGHAISGARRGSSGDIRQKGGALVLKP